MMSRFTNVSSYRSGPPRFGNRPHNIDTSVKTYQLTPEQLERYRNGKSLDDILKEAKEVERAQKPKVIAYTKYEEVVAERDELKKQLEELKANIAPEDDNGIEWLKREAIHAHKLLTEKEKELEQLRELFETAMSDKERLHKENLLLENQIQRLKEANDELTAKNERYFADLMRLEQEVKGLRLYALQKLHIDVYGA
jgi:DNA repair exonuclease SbcCD ATPase subunit